MKLLGKADTNWTQEGAFQAMSGFLAQNDSVDGVVYEYADGFRGGLRAWQEAGKEPERRRRAAHRRAGPVLRLGEGQRPGLQDLLRLGPQLPVGRRPDRRHDEARRPGRADRGRHSLPLPAGDEGHVQPGPAARRVGLDPSRRRHAEGDVREVVAATVVSTYRRGRGLRSAPVLALAGARRAADGRGLARNRRHLEALSGRSGAEPGRASNAGPARSTPSSARTAPARARSSASPAARSSPTAAASTIMGEPLTAADPLLARSLGLATVYQDDSLVRELTVAENLYLGADRASGRRSPASANGRRSSSRPTTSASRPTRSSAR